MLIIPPGYNIILKVYSADNSHAFDLECLVEHFDHVFGELQLRTQDDRAEQLFFGSKDCELKTTDVPHAIHSITLCWFKVANATLIIHYKESEMKEMPSNEEEKLRCEYGKRQREAIKEGASLSLNELKVKFVPV